MHSNVTQMFILHNQKVVFKLLFTSLMIFIFQGNQHGCETWSSGFDQSQQEE